MPAAYQANKTALGVSTPARDNQLERVATGGAAALGHDAAALAEPVAQTGRASQPRWWPGAPSKGRDGTHVASTAQRLQAWCGTWVAPRLGPALGGWTRSAW